MTAASTTPALRPATPDDWPAIATLLGGDSLPLAGAEEHLDDFIVAEAGRIVGCIGLERYRSDGLLRSLAVAADRRGEGLGRALVAACLAHARRSGVNTVVLLTETAEPFFTRLGFVRIDRAAVPTGLHGSRELRGACPATAVAMVRTLAGPESGTFETR